MINKIMPVLMNPVFSKLINIALDMQISKYFIEPFIRKYSIDMDEYIETDYKSFKDFFTRKIKSNARPADDNTNHLISPCDGTLIAYTIDEDSVFTVYDNEYTLESLFQSKKIADYYTGGTLLMFNIDVSDYHRYCFIDNGVKSKIHHIKGFFDYDNHSEHTREFCMLKSNNFSNVLVMEVEDMLFGKTGNYAAKKYVKRGEEKGRFEYGKGTIILCLKKGIVSIDESILSHSENNISTIVRMGEKIGAKNI